MLAHFEHLGGAPDARDAAKHSRQPALRLQPADRFEDGLGERATQRLGQRERVVDLVVGDRRDGDDLRAAATGDLAQLLERRPAPRLARPREHERHERVAGVHVERAQQEDGALAAHVRQLLEQLGPDRVRVRRTPPQRLQRHGGQQPVIGARARQQPVLVLRREQLDGALEALVREQRSGTALRLRQRPQSVEQLLELRHLSPASSS